MQPRQPREGVVTTADGARLFYRLLGDGPPVVVPNGLYLLEDFASLAGRHTLIAYDPRHRGLSEPAGGVAERERGIHQDVDDLEAVRRHFAIDELTLIGHSYIGLMVILYALAHADRVGRMVQLGPMEPFAGKQYPPHLTATDDVLRQALAALAALQAERERHDPVSLCRQAWALLRPIYVVDRADADKVRWERCELANERGFFSYWMGALMPSIRALDLRPQDLARVTAPVLTVHGRRDRSAPYGGGREWALLLPQARLLTIDDAGHAPWIEAKERVLSALQCFLAGDWPAGVEKVEELDPGVAVAGSALS